MEKYTVKKHGMRYAIIYTLIIAMIAFFATIAIAAPETNNLHPIQNITYSSLNTRRIAQVAPFYIRDNTTIENSVSANYLDLLKEATKLTLLEELVISNMPRTYARSCENRIYGCEAHISAMVDLFFQQGQRTHIDPLIFAAMAKHETNFNPFAVNERTGAAGLLQLMPRQRHAANISFIHSSQYRKQCEGEYYACQEEVLQASTTLLERSIARCDNNLAHGLGMYGSGSCNGSRRFSRYVIHMARDLRARRQEYMTELTTRYQLNVCNNRI